jgi:tol-pal system protein YbgF
MRKLAFCILFVAAGCASSRQVRDDAPILPPPAEQQQERAALESRIAELQTSMTELLDRLDVLNDRINKIESAPVAPPPRLVSEAPVSRTQPAAKAAVPAATPQPSAIPRAVVSAQIAEVYRSALMLYGRGRMDDARRTFQQVFDAEPGGDLADNALYWIGETYFSAGNYAEAMRYYHRVTTEFSEQNKAPDALFKTALAYEKTSDLGMARTTLHDVVTRYPYSTAAASAKLELNRIKY